MQGSESALPHDDGHRQLPSSAAPANSQAPTQAPPVTHLLLARRLALFSDECIVRGCVSPALPDVDAVMHIAYGYGNMGLMRKVAPRAHQQLTKALYAERGEHKLTPTSEKLVCDLLQPAIPPHEVLEMLRGTEEGKRLQKQRFLPWRAYLRAVSLPDSHADPELLQVVEYLKDRETFFAVLKHHERANRPSPQHDALERRLTPAMDAWKKLAPNLGLHPLLLVEEFLHAIAHFDCVWAGSSTDTSSSRVLPYLEARRRPMGHWLQEVAHAYDQKSLTGLQEQLFRLNVKHKGRHISLDLLKKWSAARQLLLPTETISTLLGGLRAPEQISLLEGRFLLARILMFLLDVVRAGTMREEPAWDSVQAQVRTRYESILNRQAAQSSEAPPCA